MCAMCICVCTVCLYHAQLCGGAACVYRLCVPPVCTACVYRLCVPCVQQEEDKKMRSYAVVPPMCTACVYCLCVPCVCTVCTTGGGQEDAQLRGGAAAAAGRAPAAAEAAQQQRSDGGADDGVQGWPAAERVERPREGRLPRQVPPAPEELQLHRHVPRAKGARRVVAVLGPRSVRGTGSRRGGPQGLRDARGGWGVSGVRSVIRHPQGAVRPRVLVILVISKAKLARLTETFRCSLTDLFV